ncbi:hypothetical protein WR25_17398 [Diploscapter pachys]|uniref:HEAT repeat-containing protein 1 n=1 Tax=Diploscapter pachys TaxID=2018661 RepID=A0A2A2JE91_9BILA|nr:hypothetical protein WR25_17398 [Diploscapter pachys]
MQFQIILCQSAAFSLKLIAKRLPVQGESTVLSEAIQKCFDTVSEYKTLDNYLVANMLLLAGELIRSHNMKSTMMLTLPLIDICLAIIAECITLQKEAMREELKTGKRERIRQQSLVGRKLSADNLLFCALTCVQRILDRYGAFVIDKYAAIIVAYCRAAAKLNDHLRGDQSVYSSGYSLADSQSSGGPNKPNAIMRLNLIRKSLLIVEFRVIFPHFTQAVGQLKDEEKPFCCLFNLLGSYFTPMNKNYAMQLKDKLANDVFLPAMAYRVRERNPGHLECITHVETSIFAAFNSLTEILTEQQIRPLVQNIIRWAESELDLNVTPRTKIVTLFHFANSFYNSFQSLALPFFGKLIELVSKVLTTCNYSTTTDSSKLLLYGKKDSIEALEADFLIRNVIDLVRKCAQHKDFMTHERAEMVMDSLVAELENTKLAGHEQRCVDHLTEALYRVADADADIFPEMLNKIMMKTRDNRPKIRYRTLLVMEVLFDKIGDGIQPFLPNVLPFISELLEDENKQVEEQCDKVLRLLQHKFGENLTETIEGMTE